MLSSEIKSMLLYVTKRALLQDKKFWKEEGTLFLFKVISAKMCFTKFLLELPQELLQTTLNSILNSFYLELYHKNQCHGSHHALSNIFQ